MTRTTCTAHGVDCCVTCVREEGQRVDLDALEKQLAGMAYEPIDRDTSRALLAMARRTEQAERERDEARVDCALLRSESAGLLRDLSTALGADVAEDLVDLAARRVRERDEAPAQLTRQVDAAYGPGGEIDQLMHERDEARAALTEASRTPGVFARYLPMWPESRADVQGGGLPVPSAMPLDHEALAGVDIELAARRSFAAWLSKSRETYYGSHEWADLAESQREAWRAAAGAIARPPLDPAHVEVLRGMLDEEREKHVTAMHAQMRHYYEARIAALEAVLGEP